MNWQPSASIEVLKARAALLGQIRQFFADSHCLEVDVPVLGRHGVTDPHIDCIEAVCNNRKYYLQSSPEYFMKRLLAAGSGDIYALGKAFRDGESGVRHNPEFTMLEWYRVGWDEHQLMDEVADLVQAVTPHELSVCRLSYQDAFQLVFDCDPHTASLNTLQALAAEVAGAEDFNEDRSTCLDLLFSLKVEPQLPPGLVFVFDYPACQSALAQLDIDSKGIQVARRFEAFLNGTELANGYFELTHVEEQRQRFDSDNLIRKTLNKQEMAPDQLLLSALSKDFPVCAGVALGVDRLFMKIMDIANIHSVIAFSDSSL